MSEQEDISKSRRGFLISGLSLAATSALASAISKSDKAIAGGVVKASNNQSSTSAVSSIAKIQDGLAHPIPYSPKLGIGKKHGIALGGGGLYLLSFYCGYFYGLKKAGIDLSTADVVVGTSAGSLAGSLLTSRRLWRARSILRLVSDFPKLFSLLLPSPAVNPSQQRSRDLLLMFNTADTENIKAIGASAMAARNTTSDSDHYYKSVKKIVGDIAWPSSLHITSNDCYSGERLIISAQDKVPAYVACAASSSLPGKTGPTWVKDRLCMDGGICETSTHCDVISGVKKALVISLGDGTRNEVIQGLRVSSLPDTLNQEVAKLKAEGTEVFQVVAGLLPGVSKVDNIMDPKWVEPMMKYGYKRAAEDAAKIKKFWA